VVKLIVKGGSLTRKPKRSLRWLLVEVPWQINEYLNTKLPSICIKVHQNNSTFSDFAITWTNLHFCKKHLYCRQSPCSDPWKLSSQLKQMSTPRECYRGGKRINPRTRKWKISDANISTTVPSVLQLNIEGLSASKIWVIKQKALIILFQKNHCTNVDRLMIPNFTLAGSTLSKKHGLATFIHNKLSWTFVDQSPDESAIEWLCIDVDGSDIRSLTSTNLLLPDLHQQPSQCSLTSTSILVILIANIQTGDATLSMQMENAWLTGRRKTISFFYTTTRIPLTSTLDATYDFWKYQWQMFPWQTYFGEAPQVSTSTITD